MANKTDEKYTEKEMRENMTEIKTGRRVFECKNYGLVQIRFPKPEENRLADWEYSKVFNQAIVDGLPTNKEMTRIIEQRQLWTKVEEDQLEALKTEINKQLTILSKMETEKNINKTQERINELRQAMFNLQQERQKYFNNTAESKADEARVGFLISKCTENADTGKSLWASYDAYKNEEDQEVVNIIAYQFITFINGLPSDFLSAPSTSNEEVEPTE